MHRGRNLIKLPKTKSLKVELNVPQAKRSLLKRGMKAWVQTEEGQRQVTVVKVGMFKAQIDVNHPLAGKTLTFKVEVLNVRPASSEEIAHGHAHGEGGHQH